MKYYFLGAWLPDLARDDRKLRVDLADFLEERDQMASSDVREIDLILLGLDVFIIERLLTGKTVEAEHALNGVDFWRDEIKSPKEAPEFLIEFLGGLSGEGFGPDVVDRLWSVYYEHVLAETKNDFLRDHVHFERDLKNIQAAIRARKAGESPADRLVGESEVVEALGRSSAEDFGLGRDLPWLEKLNAAASPLEVQDLIEQISWDHVDETVGTDPFDFRAILGYFLKVQILTRRLGLREDAGMEIVRDLEGR